MIAAVENVPLEVRADAALRLIAAGEDPMVMLSVAVWPNSAPAFDSEPTISVMEFCKNGHPWNEENTRIRPEGWRKCRACEREWKSENRGKLKSYRKRVKVPCAYCGGPASSSRDNKGALVARCRKCYLEHRKGMFRSHA